MKPFQPQDMFDKKALGRLFNEYAPRVRNLAIHILGDPVEADDVVQEVFMTLWEQRVSMVNVRNIDDYIYRMTRNASFNILKHRRVVENYAHTVPNDDIASVVEDGGDERLALIREIVHSMPSQRRQVFTMAYLGSLSYKEIAAELEISTATVHYHISKALEELRRKLR